MKLNKKITTLLLSLVAIACLTFAVSLPVSAEELQAHLLDLPSSTNLAIALNYTDDGSGVVPTVAFIAPNGERFQEGVTDPSRFEVQHVEGKIYFRIPDARAGSWQICYDSAFSGRLSVEFASYARDLLIRSFTILEQQSGRLNVSYVVDFPVQGKTYQYTISAVLLDENGSVIGEKQLESGSARTGNSRTQWVNLSGLSSYGNYRLRLDVAMSDYGTEVQDSVLSSEFSYENPNDYEALGDYHVLYNRTENELTVDWSAVAVRRASKYILGVWVDGKEVYANQFDSDVTSASMSIDKAAASIQIKLAYLYNNRTSKEKVINLSLPADFIEFLTADETASSQAQVKYTLTTETAIHVQVGDRASESKTANGVGTFSVALDEGENRIKVGCYLSEYLVVYYEKTVYSDRVAPPLAFFENLDAVTTYESKFILVGQTEYGSIFTVNGKQYELNTNGSFSVDLSLANGENAFEVISADAVGNQAVKRFTIYRDVAPVAIGGTDGETPSLLDWAPLVFSTAGSLIAAILVLILFSGREGKKLTLSLVLKRTAIGAWIVTAGSVVGTVWMLIEKNRAEANVTDTTFFDTVKESMDRAYEMILLYRQYTEVLSTLIAVTIAIAAVAIVITVAAVVVAILRKRSKKPKVPKAPKPPKPQRPVAPQVPASVATQTVGNAQTSDGAQVPAPEAEKKKFCPSCGAPYIGTPAFCGKCGHALKH